MKLHSRATVYSSIKKNNFTIAHSPQDFAHDYRMDYIFFQVLGKFQPCSQDLYPGQGKGPGNEVGEVWVCLFCLCMPNLSFSILQSRNQLCFAPEIVAFMIYW